MSDGSHLLQRLVGENVKLRRKIDAVQEDNKQILRLRALLKLESEKVARLQKNQAKAKRLHEASAARDATAKKNYKFRQSLMRKVEKLEKKLRYETLRSESRREQVLQVIKQLRGVL
tara:strand:- start:486 stop:836 length:351 start_codon:yes stop_codon:yes gene_type:complete